MSFQANSTTDDAGQPRSRVVASQGLVDVPGGAVGVGNGLGP